MDEKLLSRMQVALDRIEAVLSEPRPAVDNERLMRRHDALRAKTAAALRDLDALIARKEEAR